MTDLSTSPRPSAFARLGRLLGLLVLTVAAVTLTPAGPAAASDTYYVSRSGLCSGAAGGYYRAPFRVTTSEGNADYISAAFVNAEVQWCYDKGTARWTRTPTFVSSISGVTDWGYDSRLRKTAETTPTVTRLNSGYRFEYTATFERASLGSFSGCFNLTGERANGGLCGTWNAPTDRYSVRISGIIYPQPANVEGYPMPVECTGAQEGGNNSSGVKVCIRV